MYSAYETYNFNSFLRFCLKKLSCWRSNSQFIYFKYLSFKGSVYSYFSFGISGNLRERSEASSEE